MRRRVLAMLLLGLGGGLGACMSKQRGLNPAEQRVEQALKAYIQTKMSCEKTWYEQWLPFLFTSTCSASLYLYSGIDVNGQPMDYDSTGIGFSITVEDHNGILCNRDSSELKAEARFLARQLRPALLPRREYQWISVEYSTCEFAGNDRQGCSQTCYKVVQLAVQDTMTWPEAKFYPSTELYMQHYMLMHRN